MENQQVNFHPEDIGNQARRLLVEFIRQRITRETGLATVITEDLLMSPDSPRGPEFQHEQELGTALRRIGDELDGDYQLQTLIHKISLSEPRQSFLRVAKEIFSDGVCNWGRIVALFYFGFKLAVRAVASNLLSCLRNIVEWTVQFIVDRVANWIIQRGGWEAIHEYFGATAVQCTAVMLAAVLTCAFIYLRSRSMR